jgi:hypothetical protein
MAFDGNSQLVMHVSGRDRSTAAWVLETLAATEYMYNIVAVVELKDMGYDPDLAAVSSILRSAEEVGIAGTNSALRAFVPEGGLMELNSLESDNSFSLSLGGIARALSVIVSTFDPLAREERRERLRHQRVMNQWKEEDAQTRVVERRIELVVRSLADERSNFNKHAREELGEVHHKELRALLGREFDRSLLVLDQNEVKIVQ